MSTTTTTFFSYAAALASKPVAPVVEEPKPAVHTGRKQKRFVTISLRPDVAIPNLDLLLKQDQRNRAAAVAPTKPASPVAEKPAQAEVPASVPAPQPVAVAAREPLKFSYAKIAAQAPPAAAPQSDLGADVQIKQKTDKRAARQQPPTKEQLDRCVTIFTRGKPSAEGVKEAINKALEPVFGDEPVVESVFVQKVDGEEALVAQTTAAFLAGDLIHTYYTWRSSFPAVAGVAWMSPHYLLAIHYISKEGDVDAIKTIQSVLDGAIAECGGPVKPRREEGPGYHVKIVTGGSKHCCALLTFSSYKGALVAEDCAIKLGDRSFPSQLARKRPGEECSICKHNGHTDIECEKLYQCCTRCKHTIDLADTYAQYVI